MTWADLDRELAAWGEAGQVATFWWRDDDVTRPGAALDRLLRIAEGAAVPLALAAIPAEAEPGLRDALRASAMVAVLQHGYAHRNHAPPGAKKAELGPHRPLVDMADELVAGRRRLRTLFGSRFQPVLVPPWNRIDPALAAELARLGYAGLSTYGGDKPNPLAAPGLAVVDTHIDVVDWRGGRGFVGEAAAIGLAVRHLTARRRGAVATGEPTGLLTHHRVHGPDVWAFVKSFVPRVAAHPAARWLGAADLFVPARAAKTDGARIA